MKYSRKMLDDKMSERTKEIFEKDKPGSKNKDLSK